MTLSIPPLKAAGLDVKALEDLRGELRDLGRELSLAEGHLAGLEARRSRARRADAEAGAKAKRSGKKDPGPKAEDELDAEIEGARRTQAVLVVAVEQVETEITSLVAEKAPELLARLDENLEGLNAGQLEAVATLEETRSKRLSASRARAWIEGFIPSSASLEESQAPGQDYLEVANLNTGGGGASPRPTDDEIQRVLAWFRHEAGDAGPLEALEAQGVSELTSLIDGRGSQPNSFRKLMAQRGAETDVGD